MSDSEDDMPIAALMGNKKAAKSGPTKMDIDDDDDDDAPISSLVASGKRKRDSADKKPAKKPAKPAAKPAAKKKPKKQESEDEEDDDEIDDDALDEDDEDEEEEEEELDSEEDEKPKKKKAPSRASTSSRKSAAEKKPAKKAAVKKERKPAAKKVNEEEAQAGSKSVLSSKAVRIEQAMKAFKWWDEEPLPQGLQWLGLEHNGIFFPPDYERHGIKMLYDGQEVDLPAELEEVATFYASIPPDGPQLGNEETRKIFQKNFFDEFKKMLSNKTDDDLGIKSFKLCDFSRIAEYLDQQKLIKKAATDEEKKLSKKDKERRQDFYGYAIVDGRIEKVGNYNMEPPGLFRGRGKHPLMGKIKQRCMPERVTINIGPDAKVPPCPLPGHAWDRVQHDNRVTWLASWKENVLNGVKYVMLSASSSFKGKSDKEKYDKAARLKNNIHKIRHDYEQNLTTKDRGARQLATAMWIIDKLALRVGGEKGEDEADTVGCCSLRKEHLKFAEEDEVYEIELEFLGKDSMLFKQTIDFSSYGSNGVKVYRNLEDFTKKKKPAEDVFDTLTPTVLNAHLSSLMPGLSAKVFRTYNASETLQNELPKPEDLRGMTVADKVLAYNEANRKVAILCNHQRTVTKAMENTLENLAEKLTLLKEQKRELQQQKEQLKAGKTSKVRTRAADEKLAEDAVKAMEKADDMRKKAKAAEEKIAATAATEAAKELKRKAQAAKAKDAHLFARTPTLEQVERQLDKWAEKIRKLEVDIRNKDDNKEVALGTSKINYMDPRISIAWCKRNEVPIERIFAKTLRDKFVWSMGVAPDWRFEGLKSKSKK